MTEADWLTCDDPEPMLAHLGPTVSERKLRLFICACCRRLRSWLRDERSQHALEVAERYADGGSSVKELAATRSAAEKVAWNGLWYIRWYRPGREAVAARHCVKEGSPVAAGVIAYATVLEDARAAMPWVIIWAEALSIKRAEQACLLRDLFGNPFRPASVDPAWLAWNDGCVAHLARAIHDQHDFGDLPILADALTDAGCYDETILDHCRSRSSHARGCWVVEALRGQQECTMLLPTSTGD